MIIGTIAQEPRGTLTDPDLLTDVAFHSTFNGTNGGTDAIDDSTVAAPLTFNGAVALSNEQKLFDFATSAKFSSIGQYIRAPANTLYDIGDDNFTVECFMYVSSFIGMSAVGHVVGVWQNDSIKQWRMVIDSKRMFFQALQSGTLIQWSENHGMLTGVWYHLAWCKAFGILRGFVGIPGQTSLMIRKGAMAKGFDGDGSTIPLYIGGNIISTEGLANIYLQDMRISKAPWYQSDAGFVVPSSKLGQGFLYPSLVSSPDVFHQPSVAAFIERPGLVVDADSIFAPTMTHSPNVLNVGTIGANISNSGGPNMVGSRSNGNVLVAWLSVNVGGQTFSVGGGWTIGDQQSDGNSSSVWAWRIVDGSEAVPTFTWTTAAQYHSKMIQMNGNDPSAPIGNVLKNVGAGANLIVNGGTGLTTTRSLSLVLAIELTCANSQVLPVPSGYTNVAQQNDANGSDRAASQPQAASGSVSGGLNLTIASAFWHGYLIEIKRAP